ncbi:MAG: aminoacyl-tRNA hydrolase [Parachlamydiales bacterium]
MGSFLIAGLGNPGKEYLKTRHNLGFLVVEALSRKWEVLFQKKAALKGALAQKKENDVKTYLFKPMTYMNLSGEAVKAALDYLKIDLSNLLVVVDDAALPFGEMRLKKESGSGGHNGLKSIEQQLSTQAYLRLRIGVGEQKEKNLEAHVLGKFTSNELEYLPTVEKRAIEVIELFLLKGFAVAQNVANVRQIKTTKDEE